MDIRVIFDDDNSNCQVYSENEIIFDSNSTKKDCLLFATAYGNGDEGNISPVCNVEQTAVFIAKTSDLMTQFLYTEIVIVTAVFAIRVLKQLRPI